MAAHRSIIRQLAFMGGLDGRHRAILHRRDLDQLLRAAFLAAADVKVIADQQEKRLIRGELLRAPDGVSVIQPPPVTKPAFGL